MADTKSQSSLQALLHPEGMYNPALRFAFTNITDEPFQSYWAGQPIVIKAGQSVELPHHLAVKLTKELVDKIMMGEAKLDEVEYYKKNPNTAPNAYRSPKGTSIGVPAARKPWEEKVCRLMETDEESPEMSVMRAEIRDQVLRDLNREQSHAPVQAPTSIDSFGKIDSDGQKKESPKPMRLKNVK